MQGSRTRPAARGSRTTPAGAGAGAGAGADHTAGAGGGLSSALSPGESHDSGDGSTHPGSSGLSEAESTDSCTLSFGESADSGDASTGATVTVVVLVSGTASASVIGLRWSLRSMESSAPEARMPPAVRPITATPPATIFHLLVFMMILLGISGEWAKRAPCE